MEEATVSQELLNRITDYIGEEKVSVGEIQKQFNLDFDKTIEILRELEKRRIIERYVSQNRVHKSNGIKPETVFCKKQEETYYSGGAAGPLTQEDIRMIIEGAPRNPKQENTLAQEEIQSEETEIDVPMNDTAQEDKKNEEPEAVVEEKTTVENSTLSDEGISRLLGEEPNDSKQEDTLVQEEIQSKETEIDVPMSDVAQESKKSEESETAEERMAVESTTLSDDEINALLDSTITNDDAQEHGQIQEEKNQPTELTIPNELQSVAAESFQEEEKNQPTELTIPSELQSVAAESFQEEEKNQPTELTIPNELQSVAAESFQGEEKNQPTELTIPSELQSVTTEVFQEKIDPELENIKRGMEARTQEIIADTNKRFQEINQDLHSKTQEILAGLETKTEEIIQEMKTEPVSEHDSEEKNTPPIPELAVLQQGANETIEEFRARVKAQQERTGISPVALYYTVKDPEISNPTRVVNDNSAIRQDKMDVETMENMRKALEARAQEIIAEKQKSPETQLNTEITEPLEFLLQVATAKYNDKAHEIELATLESQKKRIKEKIKERADTFAYTMEQDHHDLKGKTDTLNRSRDLQHEIINRKIQYSQGEITYLEKLFEAEQEKVQSLEQDYQAVKSQVQASSNRSEQQDKDIYKYNARTEQLEWTIEREKEYLNEIYSEISEHHERIEDLEDLKKHIDIDCKTEIKNLLEGFQEKYGEPAMEHGKPVASLQSIPFLKELNERLEKTDNQITRLTRKPQEIYDNIKKMMQQGASVDDVESELDLLLATISDPEIVGLLSSEKKAHQDCDIKIKELTKLKEYYEDFIKKDDYYKESELENDGAEIEVLHNNIAACQEQIQNLKTELEMGGQQHSIKELKILLKRIETAIKNKTDLLDIATPTEAESLKQQIDNLEKRKQEIENRIESSKRMGKVHNSKQIHRRISKLNAEIIEQKRKIEKLRKKDYYDYDKKNAHIQKIQEIEEQIKELKEEQKYLGTHTKEEIKEQILTDYKKLLNNDHPEPETESEDLGEEIEDNYTEPKPGLLARIKSKAFIKIAAIAFMAIVTVATVGFGLVSHFRKKPTEQVSEINKITASADISDQELNNIIEDAGLEKIDSSDQDNALKEESEELPVEVQKVKNDIDNALNDITSVNKNVVYETAVDAAEEKNGLIVTSNVECWQNETTQPGKLYAIIDGVAQEISLEQAPEYLSEGIAVVSSYINENGTLGFLHLETPAENNELISDGKTR